MVVCNGCKYEYRDDARFCPRCGEAKPDVFVSNQNEPVQRESESDSQGNEVPFNPFAAQKTFDDKHVRSFLIGFAVVAFVVVAFVVFLVIRWSGEGG